MMIIRTLFLLLATGLTLAFADVPNCTNCYQEGLDARQRGELESALRLFERGCEQDDGAACNAASHMLSNGEGAPEDDTRAVSLGLRSCDLGYWEACSKLGVALVRAENPAAAANRYFERACEGGSAPFCSDLAAALAKGTGGLEVDIPRAAALFQTACEGGWPKACDNAELLAKASRKEPPKEQSEGWSISAENFSFSTREDPAEDGRIASSSVEPDDNVGRCVTNALGRAHIEGLSCRLEAGVSR
jgi:TPR repeat protein